MLAIFLDSRHRVSGYAEVSRGTLNASRLTPRDVLIPALLANAAGFDARMARIPSRGDTFFSVQRPTTYFIDSFSVAVKVGDNWSFYDPATNRLRPKDVTTVCKVSSDPEDIPDSLGLADIYHFAQFIRGTKAPPRACFTRVPSRRAE